MGQNGTAIDNSSFGNILVSQGTAKAYENLEYRAQDEA